MASTKHPNPVSDVITFAIGSLVGAVVGGGLALWFVPRSGQQTRQEIQARGLELRAQAEQTAAQAREKIDGPSVERLLSEAKANARHFQDGH